MAQIQVDTSDLSSWSESGVRTRRIRTQSGSWVTEQLDYTTTRTHKGYPQVKSSIRGWVWLHRITAEDAVGRWLRKYEEVHHIDGDKDNCQPGNLLVASRRYHHDLHRRCLKVHGSWHLDTD